MAETMKVVVEVTVTREDGDHHGAITLDISNADRDDKAGAIWSGVMVGAEVTDCVATLITHVCGVDTDDKTIRLGDSRN